MGMSLHYSAMFSVLIIQILNMLPIVLHTCINYDCVLKYCLGGVQVNFIIIYFITYV